MGWQDKNWMIWEHDLFLFSSLSTSSCLVFFHSFLLILQAFCYEFCLHSKKCFHRAICAGCLYTCSFVCEQFFLYSSVYDVNNMCLVWGLHSLFQFKCITTQFKCWMNCGMCWTKSPVQCVNVNLPCCRYGVLVKNWAEFALACANDIGLAMFVDWICCWPRPPMPVWIFGKLSIFDGSIGRPNWFMLYNLLSSSGFKDFVCAVYGINCILLAAFALDDDAAWCW